MVFIASSNRFIVAYCLQSYKPVFFVIFEEEKENSEKSDSDKKDKCKKFFPVDFEFVVEEIASQKTGFFLLAKVKLFIAQPVSPPPEYTA